MPDKVIKFTWKIWMTCVALSCVFFNMSYLMAVTSPLDACGHTYCSATSMQVFHSAFMFVFGVGAVIMFVMGVFNYIDGK